MSFLVSLDRREYQDGAMTLFRPTPGYTLDNARAMMWMAQLAYDTDDGGKVDDVLRAWTLNRRALISNDPATGLPLRSACVVVAGGRDATIVSFSGTDPLKISDWITDFTPLPSATQRHTGFKEAVDSVWGQIKTVIANRPNTERALFFTGHSLGGALALIAAERAISDQEVRAHATAVYVYGCPRAGGARFFDDYTPKLGDATFRLVHGTDIVSTVPPSGPFRHVGRAIQCDTDGVFDAHTPMSTRDDDKPDFVASMFSSARADLGAAISGNLFQPVGRRLLARAAGLLPRMVRDHVPDSYFRALSITLN
jgi:Lipase (class 3)